MTTALPRLAEGRTTSSAGSRAQFKEERPWDEPSTSAGAARLVRVSGRARPHTRFYGHARSSRGRATKAPRRFDRLRATTPREP